MNRFVLRYSLPVLLLALSGNVSAVGLGELRGQPALGERIRLEVDLLGGDNQKLDASCFRLVRPSGDSDLPWLRAASLSVRKGAQTVLEIRSDSPLREPIMQVAVQLGCGHEISRDYVVLASPSKGEARPDSEAHPQEAEAWVRPSSPIRRPVKVRSVTPSAAEPPVRLAPSVPRRNERNQLLAAVPDRLVLSGGDVGDPSLRLATELLQSGVEAKEAQRDILRLEFRMLMAMHQQATSQMATAEKLRAMESTLGELQQRAAGFAERVEKDGVGAPVAAQPPVASVVRPEGADSPPVKPIIAQEEISPGLSEWSLYGVLLGALVGLGGWLGWRNYSRRKIEADDGDSPLHAPELRVDPKRADEHEEPGGIDLPFEPAAMGMPMQVDLELDAGGDSLSRRSEIPEQVPAPAHDSMMSIHATSLDEHFEANPVMELADIMLSFGRVKGAAQALQEYIDNNPQEALQPWIRLMDVYRMAGMRAEFENVAKNLNLHFNVEVQSWDSGSTGVTIPAPESGAELPVAPRAQCLEDLPRLANTVVGLWGSGDVVGYLYQLLRDNRGGQRMGFSLQVVEDILFLIELKETANRMQAS